MILCARGSQVSSPPFSTAEASVEMPHAVHSLQVGVPGEVQVDATPVCVFHVWPVAGSGVILL